MTEKDFLQHCIDESDALICYHNIDGKYIYVSKAIQKLTGYTQSEMDGKNPYDFFHPDDNDYIGENSANPAVYNEHGIAIDYRFRKKDGEYLWFNTKTKHIKNDQNQIVGLLTQSQNVTEKVNLEDEVERLRKIKTLISEFTGIGFWEVDREKNTLFWGQEVYKLHQVSEDFKPTVTAALDFYTQDSKKILAQILSDSADSGDPFDLVLNLITAKDVPIKVRVVGKTQMRNGKVAKISGIIQNVTREIADKEKLEALVTELRKHNDVLQDYIITFTPVS